MAHFADQGTDLAHLAAGLGSNCGNHALARRAREYPIGPACEPSQWAMAAC